MIGNTNARGNNIKIENVGTAEVSKNTRFNSDGSIIEIDIYNNTKTTVFNSDGSITEITKGSDGTVISTKITKFNTDGSISEVVE